MKDPLNSFKTHTVLYPSPILGSRLTARYEPEKEASDLLFPMSHSLFLSFSLSLSLSLSHGEKDLELMVSRSMFLTR